MAPRFAGALNAGIGTAFPSCTGGRPVAEGDPGAELLGLADVVPLWSSLLTNTTYTTAATTATATTEAPAIVAMRRRLACLARRSSCRSSLRLAVARRC